MELRGRAFVQLFSPGTRRDPVLDKEAVFGSQPCSCQASAALPAWHGDSPVLWDAPGSRGGAGEARSPVPASPGQLSGALHRKRYVELRRAAKSWGDA